jgi:hypothetical protein
MIQSDMSMITPSQLTDDELVAEVHALVTSERRATARLVLHLAALDARGLHLAAGFRSLHLYCVEVLRLSEHAAYNRIAAARMARRFPVIVGMLEAGQINLSTVKVLAPHLTEANHRELLAASVHKSRFAVQEMVAARFPQAAAAALSAPPMIVPVGPDRYEVRFTVRGSTVGKLRAAQDLLGHAVPDRSGAEILDRALTAVLEKSARVKAAPTGRSLAARALATHSRHVPAHVQREVWERDGGQCAFVAASGRRCDARSLIEFHHHGRPWAVGGPSTTDNIQLRCRAHNRYEAEVYFGPLRAAMAAHHAARPGAST